MENKELDKSLIRLYENGHSLDFIARVYYRKANINKQNYYVSSGFYVSRKNITMAQAKNYIASLIYCHILQKNKLT